MKEIDKKIRLSLLKQWELIDMIVDMEKTITKYEDKERHETKQRPIPYDKLGKDWKLHD